MTSSLVSTRLDESCGKTLGTTTSATYVDKIANFNPKPQLQGGTLYAFVLSAVGATGAAGYNAQ